MRVFAVLCLCSWLMIPGQSVESKPHPGSGLSLPEYVSLQRWAEENQLQFSRKDDEVRVAGKGFKLEFKVNSLRAQINEIALFLAHPIQLHQGTVSVAQKDIERSLRPIVTPPKKRAGENCKVIALSAGHGGKDCGNVVGSSQEKKYTLLLVQELQKRLKSAGFKSVLIRSTDKYIELEDRALIAKRAHADILLEVHYNCANPGNRESRGVEVYALTPEGANSTNGGANQFPGLWPGNRHDDRNILLAYQMQSCLVTNVGLADRGVRRARFVVLREAEMPAVLIEGGFMSHPEELKGIQNDHQRRQTAQAILDGLLAYQRRLE